MKRDFRDIPGFEGYYEINSDGIVRAKDRQVNNRGTIVIRKGGIKRPHDNGRGYLQVNLHRENKIYKLYIHRLVYIAFVGEIPDGAEVDHRNNNRRDNRLRNLQLLSKVENLQKMLKHNPHVLKNLELGRKKKL